MPVILIIESENEIRRETLSSRPLTIGRSSKCHVKLADGKISGMHLSVQIGKEGRTLIKDLETTNGTFLNGSKILESHLFLDDEVTIGDITIYLDASKMGPKEINSHTRAGEKTQHTFINLPKGTKSAVQEAMKKTKDSQKTSITHTKYKDESARQREIMELLKEEPEEANKENPGMRTRVINKVKDVEDKAKPKDIGEVRTGENFELEKPSGETQMLKIDKPKKTKKK